MDNRFIRSDFICDITKQTVFPVGKTDCEWKYNRRFGSVSRKEAVEAVKSSTAKPREELFQTMKEEIEKS